jgi:alkylated DNA repair dioxygenase AlkB
MARIELGQGAWIELLEGWLPAPEAAALERRLTAELAWEQRHIVLFGKRILQPRLIAWAGELPYSYSGQTLEPRAWPGAVRAELCALHARVALSAGAAFNHVLVNRYRDGRDSMGYHADDEPELGSDPVIACLSLGRARRFLIRPKRSAKGEPPLTLLSSSGSLLVMAGTCQRFQRHALPRASETEERALVEQGLPLQRISLTYRRVLSG